MSIRWHNQLDPTIKRAAWTAEEEEILMQAHRECGNAWAEIAKRLPVLRPTTPTTTQVAAAGRGGRL